jgi:hypothetical protein
MVDTTIIRAHRCAVGSPQTSMLHHHRRALDRPCRSCLRASRLAAQLAIARAQLDGQQGAHASRPHLSARYRRRIRRDPQLALHDVGIAGKAHLRDRRVGRAHPARRVSCVSTAPWSQRRVFPYAFIVEKLSGQVFTRDGRALADPQARGPSLPIELVRGASPAEFEKAATADLPQRLARPRRRFAKYPNSIPPWLAEPSSS